MHLFNIFKTKVLISARVQSTTHSWNMPSSFGWPKNNKNGPCEVSISHLCWLLFPRKCMAICCMPGIHTDFDQTEPNFGHILGYNTMPYSATYSLYAMQSSDPSPQLLDFRIRTFHPCLSICPHTALWSHCLHVSNGARPFLFSSHCIAASSSKMEPLSSEIYVYLIFYMG